MAEQSSSSADCARPLELGVHVVGDRWLVVVGGDVDAQAAPLLYGTLREALGRARGGIELDLGKVEFCHCSDLNTLLLIRGQALDSGKTVTVREVSTAVGRLLDVTHTRPLFMSESAPVTPVGEDQDDARQEPAGGLPVDAAQDLFLEVVQLRRAMETRPVIDMARGVLMASFALNPDDAWSVLVEVSQHSNTKLHRLAQDLVDSVTGGALPPDVRQMLAAAVEAHTAAGRTV
ncbi:ANTAR domain-containing protein [Streptomyces sp. TRM66268-LWL]|uniref:ANTAR domain-containing protein n=1 Tax=Streptomyces polyasparticus TaxID=2767826 RepID=A0ABR7SFR5_9ACTN|nr:ANTAR domain-containing protein [Streptomyces polyasparticus]MBC9713427.1 ANTAR domain-containing protein [Streptomyces polyasparticus]